MSTHIRIRIKYKDLFIGPQEFVVGYSKAPEQPQGSARPICHSHAMTRTGREPATIRIAALELAVLRTAPRGDLNCIYQVTDSTVVKMSISGMQHVLSLIWIPWL